MSKKKHSYLDSLALEKSTKKTISYNFIVLLLGAVLIIAAKKFELPYPWLYVNPSYMNYAPLTWISSVWASILGIHGTIAALSITFMGMFVNQVASSAENSFESICRILLLRRKNFLEFSMDAVCGLIVGVFFIAIGGGLIHYSISLSISIYFITAYMKMYYELYSVTENKNVINDILFEELIKAGDAYHILKEESQALQNDFISALITRENISTENHYNYLTEKIIPLNSFGKSNTKTINSFEDDDIETLSKYITSISKNIRLTLEIQFLYPTVNYKAHIIIDKNTDLQENEIADISEKLTRCFNIQRRNTTHESFKTLESCVVENIYHTLITGNERSLDFGVLALSLLSSKSNHIDIMKQIDIIITSSEKRNHIEISILEAFFKKLYNIKIGGDTTENNIFVINSIINMSMYIYEKEKYEEFFKKISHIIEGRTQYSDDDINNPYLECYTRLTIRHLSNMYYTAFGVNTQYLTSKLRYLADRAGNEKLSDRQKKLIVCMRECIALLVVRLSFIITKSNKHDYNDEVITISSLIKKWINPSFLEEIYFNQEIYEILFNVPADFSSFDAEHKLTEIPDGTAAWIRTSYNFYKSIAILLYDSSENKNHLGLLFVRDRKQFVNNTKVTTHMINNIVEYVNSSEFSEIIKTIWNDKEPEEMTKKKVENLANSLEEIKTEVTKVVTDEVELSDLNIELTSQYKNEVTDKITQEISKFIDIEKAEKTNDNKHKPDYYSLIDKREVISPIDGVHYSMNTDNHALSAVHNLIRSALSYIKKDCVTVKEIYDTEILDNNNYITIEYKTESRINTYKFSRGLRMYDKEGYLGFDKPGMYYLNLEKELEIKLNKDSIASTNITIINNENVDSVYKKFSLSKDADNLLLRSEIEITINMFIEKNKEITLLFLSEERCKEINDNQEKQYQQLLLKTNKNSSSNNVIN